MATAKLKVKLRNERKFLEGKDKSDSYYNLSVSSGGGVDIKLADCEKTINWYFGKPNDPRAVNKIEVVKSLIDRVHAYLTQEVEK